jgi:hypothetical protein
MAKKLDSDTKNVKPMDQSFKYLFSEKRQRDFVDLFSRLTTDEEFRATFWDNPARALRDANLQVDPYIVDALQGADKKVLDQMITESQELMANSSSFTWEGERAVAVVPVIAAFLAGALAMRMYMDRV